ncbi:AtzH-like domain-containing protein [Pseudofrankia asymbiotica]|uniref:Amidase domain-containing protein n=1 Tax=Pseudofrankia asymbiotica TaxID=1834516 RepID=A0A1V2I0I0_9ACTN|nr:AtzH-like domain-containing protein [Pseudofrankia asymbiotica]ONH22588.1 hypothetical protein BL253_35160 [Pseudofrankia asymbiotica]
MTGDSQAEQRLLASFWAYERALVANDAAALAGWFADSADAIRADPKSLLAGNGDIAEFRRNRPPVPSRVVERLHLRWISEDTATLIAETRSITGARSTQLQIWRQGADGWRILIAQVSPGLDPSVTTIRARDTSVWRAVGAPLVPGTRDRLLAGLRVAVKDLYAVAGQPVGAGNPTWLSEASPETTHAAAVARLLDAGASVVGITQTDELASGLAGENAHYGTPPNPRVPGRVPGGSTSGSAAAVAACAADIGLGTDTAGSIRAPASYCGLYGLRTTHDLVSREGMIGLAPSFDTVGLLTRDAATLRQAAVALGLTGLAPITRLLVVDELERLADEPVRMSFDAATRALGGRRGLPVESEPTLTGGDLDEWFAAFRTVQGAEAWQLHGDWIEAHPGTLGPAVQARFDAARALTPAARSTASEVIAKARQTVRSAIPPGTALLLPTTSGPAPLVGLDPADMEAVRAATLRLTIISSLAGLPAVSAPLLDRGSHPVGLSLVGAPGTDLDLIDVVSP